MFTDSNKMLVVGLVVVAVLLAAIAGVIIYQKSTALPEPTGQVTAPTGSTGAPTGSTGAPTGATGAPTGGAAAPVDPKAATKVPKGTEPEAFVKAYYTACEKGDWQKAFDALPADKKAGNSPEQLKAQVSGYGIKEFNVVGSKIEGDAATVVVNQVTASYGTFENTWTFQKKDGVWYVASKAVTGMK